jgi:hypothetical protein
MTSRTHRAYLAAISASALVTLRVFAGGTALQSVPGPAFPDVQKLGPRVGERIPDFMLTDQHGETRTLGSLLAPNGLMLVFFRSADW